MHLSYQQMLRIDLGLYTWNHSAASDVFCWVSRLFQRLTSLQILMQKCLGSHSMALGIGFLISKLPQISDPYKWTEIGRLVKSTHVDEAVLPVRLGCTRLIRPERPLKLGFLMQSSPAWIFVKVSDRSEAQMSVGVTENNISPEWLFFVISCTAVREKGRAWG